MKNSKQLKENILEEISESGVAFSETLRKVCRDDFEENDFEEVKQAMRKNIEKTLDQ